MVAVWYAIVAVTLTVWAVLDGFDFGAGIVQRLVARTEEERGTVIAAIGPVWDGNEVWLVIAGGVFFFAFPHAYAAALSGMYLPLMMVLWLLVFRGVSIELRGQVPHPLWRAGWDALFALSSTVMAFVAGVALANVIRGVPLDETGWFHLDLFALRGPRAGALDAYTALVGLMGVVVLATHGASYVAWKTEGTVHDRSVVVAKRAWLVTIVLASGVTAATALVRPAMFAALAGRPWIWPLPVLAVASPVAALQALARGKDLRAFLASCAFVASLLLATAGTLYPVILWSTLGRAYDLDASRAASGPHGLTLGLAWWAAAMVLALLYFVNLSRSTRGKVKAGDYGH
jgi:cytochrome d ubiquinol oxidase subunit II